MAGLCLCACAALVLGAGGLWLAQRAGLVDAAAPRDPAAPPQPAPTPDAAAYAEMDAIQEWVVERRGLQPVTGGVERKFLSTSEVLDRTLADFEADTTPAEWEDATRSLALMGLLPPGFDLQDLYLRLYSEGVAGFYDPETGELVVVSDSGGLNAYEQVTFAHEYNHALQDQNFDLEAMGLSEAGWEADSERAAAIQALVEGDASVLEAQYKDSLGLLAQWEYDLAVNAVDISIYSELPAYLLEDFIFPYTYGRDFVERFYQAGGWARVDEVWRNPPQSTEHILHPERYEAGDNPLPVPRPALTATLGAGWREMEANTLGEWFTYLILAKGEYAEARLPEAEARAAAEGWGGDGYAVYVHEASGQLALALHTQWDTTADAEAFGAAFEAYAAARFGREVTLSGARCWEAAEIHCFFRQGAHTLWLAAPDLALIEQLRAEFPDLQ